MSSARCQPFCSGLNMSKHIQNTMLYQIHAQIWTILKWTILAKEIRKRSQAKLTNLMLTGIYKTYWNDIYNCGLIKCQHGDLIMVKLGQYQLWLYSGTLTHCGLVMPYGNTDLDGSTLVQVMACCLMAPSHSLNQYWLIISEVQWQLTHWGRDKMAAFSQTTLSNASSWLKMLEFQLRFHWSLFLRVQLTIIQHWFR